MLAAIGLLVAQLAHAQRVPAPPARRDSAVRDTLVRRAPRRLPNSIPDSLLRPPITPRAAFVRSFLLPGWGQTGLRRSTAASVFAGAEVGAVYMVMKSRADLKRAKALVGLDSISVGDPSLGETVTRIPAVPQSLVNARRLHLEDWLAVLIFNHVLAGADAYVAANLWDLPARVSITQTPAGPGLGASIRW
jgi:xanthosine utilization system XapX-like protein